jgi:hypothetical protein
MCRSVSPDAIRRTAPDRLSAIRPQVEQRLTAPPQLRTNPLRLSLLLSRRRRAPLFGGRFLFAALSAARRLVVRPLTLPVAPCVVTQRKTLSDSRAPGPLPPPARQREWLSRSEAPSVDKCGSPSAFLPRGAPITAMQLVAADRLPTLFRSPLCSRTEELDPQRWSQALHPWP